MTSEEQIYYLYLINVGLEYLERYANTEREEDLTDCVTHLGVASFIICDQAESS